jgi:mono/diheme cytochrome c family protein
MKKLSVAVILVGLSLCGQAWADGASTYKAKCAMCHGAAGEGKKGPALKGTGKTADDIVALLTKGDPAKKAPHTKAVGGLTADDAKAVADYIKTL